MIDRPPCPSPLMDLLSPLALALPPRAAGPRRDPDLDAPPPPAGACATRACRWCTRRCRARRASGATCRSRCSSLGVASLILGRRASGRDRQRAGRTDDGHPRHRRLAQHVRHRHRAQPAAGRRGGRGVVHLSARARPPRSASSPSPASPRSSRRRRPIARSCSTSSRQPGDRAADGGRQRASSSRSTRSPRSTQRRAERARRRGAGRAAAAGPERRLCARHHRAPDRWREQRRPGPDRGRRGQAAARGLRVYTIGFGTDDPGAQSPRCGPHVHRREPSRAPRRRRLGWRRSAGGGGGGGFRRGDRRGDAQGGRGHDRWRPTTRPASADELQSVFARPADEPDHQARGRSRSASSSSRSGRCSSRVVDPARPGLAPAAVGGRAALAGPSGGGSDPFDGLGQAAGPGVAMTGEQPVRGQAIERRERVDGEDRIDGERSQGRTDLPVVTERVVIASPTKMASTSGTWNATEPGVWPGSPMTRGDPAPRRQCPG